MIQNSSNFPNRYERNKPFIDDSGQELLNNKTVAIVGAGGLGGHVIEHLARIGFGHLIIVDCDNFDETNLNRQRFSKENNLGKSKAIEAKKNVEQINSNTEIVAHQVRITDLEQSILFEKADYLIDCLDNIASRFLLQDIAEKLDIPFIHGSIAGWEGQCGFFTPGSRCLDKVYANKEKTKVLKPVTISTVPGIIAAQQVNLLLQSIFEPEEFKKNYLLRYDFLSNFILEINLN